MKYLMKLLEFAKIRDISKSKNKEILKKLNIEFKADNRLIFDIFLKNSNKHLFIKWNDVEKHIMLDRIEDRTSFKSISEFNEYIKKVFNDLLDNHFYEIDNSGRYALHLIENNFYLLVDINYDNLFKEYTQFVIPTISITTPNNVHKIIEINDEYF